MSLVRIYWGVIFDNFSIEMSLVSVNDVKRANQVCDLLHGLLGKDGHINVFSVIE